MNCLYRGHPCRCMEVRFWTSNIQIWKGWGEMAGPWGFGKMTHDSLSHICSEGRGLELIPDFLFIVIKQICVLLSILLSAIPMADHRRTKTDHWICETCRGASLLENLHKQQNRHVHLSYIIEQFMNSLSINGYCFMIHGSWFKPIVDTGSSSYQILVIYNRIIYQLIEY